jgi:chloramphenicol-sensitive protein RarD
MSSQAPAATPNFFASPVGLALICYFVWGFAPLAYVPLHHIGAEPLEIMAHRSVWAVVWAGGLVWMNKLWPEVISIFLNTRLLGLLTLAAVMIGINWGMFVYAVTNGHTMDASLGYYLNPLLNMAAGAILFKEKLDNFGKAAIALAVVGVGVQGVALGHFPYISIIIALSFATYGIIRKFAPVSALAGLLVECLILLVPSLIYLIWVETQGHGHYFQSPMNAFWFMITGPVTVLPLALFSYVARRLALSTMGFIQFIAPTITFFIGLFQGEGFSALRAVSFGFIWGGALIFAFGAWRRYSALKAA